MWPPAEPGGYSLIVDGSAELVDDGLRVTPTRAVLHRPAPGKAVPEQSRAEGGACGSDCVELPVG